MKDVNLTAHFKRSEFACKCGCGRDTVDVQLMRAVNMLRLHFNAPVKITSGFRCAKYNKKIVGAKNSYHLKGKAADIKVKKIKVADVYSYLNDLYPDTYGIGIYSSWVHIDVRPVKTRWAK